MFHAFKDPSGDLVGVDSDLLFFVDDTGHERFADPKHPVFGYGGCAVMARDYEQQLVNPWRRLKASEFGGPDVPLHAADLRRPSRGRFEALAAFFGGPFSRFAAVTRVSTQNTTPLSSYKLTATTLAGRAREIAARYATNRLVFIFESSDRLDHLASGFFPKIEFSIESDGMREALPVRWCKMKKSDGEVGLEVADFVVHTAGVHVRAHECRGSGKPWQRDFFDAVFRRIDRGLVSYFEVDSGSWAPTKEA
jgi:hypothetical protein